MRSRRAIWLTYARLIPRARAASACVIFGASLPSFFVYPFCIFNKDTTRKQRTSNVILPLRHGELHGNDLPAFTRPRHQSMNASMLVNIRLDRPTRKRSGTPLVSM